MWLLCRGQVFLVGLTHAQVFLSSFHFDIASCKDKENEDHNTHSVARLTTLRQRLFYVRTLFSIKYYEMLQCHVTESMYSSLNKPETRMVVL